MQGQPGWLPLLVATAVTFLVLAAGITLIARRRGKTPWLAGIGPQAIVALGGVAVSVHGLWGFARDTAELSPWLAVAFIAVFDAAEMTLLVMLYRAADPKVGWTDELRLMHRTAWTLVGFSSLMNAVHAPNWWARPVMAAIPPLATWLIELQLRSKLHRTDKNREVKEGGRPGPMRLLLLIWQHAWAGLFASLGLDPGQSASGIARAARAQKAARRVYRLRLALTAPGAGAGRGQRRVARRRRKSQKALDKADVATDRGQALAMVRRLAALTRADDVAQLDYANPTTVLELLEGLAVTEAAEHAEASSRAEQAEAARKRAESARQEAEAARQRAEEATEAAQEHLESLREEIEKAVGEAEAARQRAADAREEENTARQRAATASGAAQQELNGAHERARRELDHLQQEARKAQQTLTDLTSRARNAEQAAQQQEAALAQLSTQVREAELLRERLAGDLAPHAAGAPEGAAGGEGPLFRSEAKQAGWEHYQNVLQHSGGSIEPTAGELADRFGVDGGNARNWLREFRAARAAQLAARPPRAAAHPTHDGALTGVS
ncbi:hypothetical protein GCM10012287_46360 [Streptomyces daqingensis]|uniref:DUF2637 domain-containing protein n=1 Tax=Streptomyces daqingensis TaxID=1472640 RepID=A0ABQ2MNN3_9ACTN|nr:DUF2637 domain-containing protein [Streptomyces daqingensis]GGO55325.1 hypothetical protein GCM10012287_46360 [Streptomyces daqingensis]